MNNILVLQTDFGMVDGAVSAMYGVALSVSEKLRVFDLTHDITPYNIFEASYRLIQAVEYWPKGSVFVSVVDPGVGSHRKSVVAKTKDGHFIVTPDNGTLTHLKRFVGIEEVREIEETQHRRKNTEASYTFHGRDIYANTGAKLASGVITFEQVGPLLYVDDIAEVAVKNIEIREDYIAGCVDILDVRFGSLWTSIDLESFKTLKPQHGDKFEVSIYNNDMLLYQNNILYGRSFADVMIGSTIIYINSLYRVGIAINQGSFAKAYNIGVGQQWRVELRKSK